MKNFLVLVLMALWVGGCAIKARNESQPDVVKEEKTVLKSAPQAVKVAKVASVVVDTEDLVALEKMNKAVEAYVLKNEPKSFRSLCKDMRFDCYVNDEVVPPGRKKSVRKVPPYASGSKMGLQGETRIHLRYDFYP